MAARRKSPKRKSPAGEGARMKLTAAELADRRDLLANIAALAKLLETFTRSKKGAG